jgi:homoserine kinase
MRFTVRTPASSANLGPGFDALGLALGLWNEATIDLSGEPGSVKLCGTEAALLDGRENLTLTAMKRLAHETGLVLPSCSLVVRTDVPVARGLGSSAAALVAGLVAANHLLNTSLAVSELYSLAWQMEGHGDNVGAALYGGAVLAVPGVANPVQLLTHGRLDLCAVVFIPQVTGLTRAARAALPPTVPHADAAFNVAAAGGLVLGLHTGNTRLIAAGMHDRLHEPYRARLFPHLEVLIAAARGAGALGVCLSGAGPAVLALAEPDRTEAVAAAYDTAAAAMGVAGEVKQLGVAPLGAEIIEENGRVTRPADQVVPSDGIWRSPS